MMGNLIMFRKDSVLNILSEWRSGGHRQGGGKAEPFPGIPWVGSAGQGEAAVTALPTPLPRAVVPGLGSSGVLLP